MFWFFCAALVIIVGLAILTPVWRTRGDNGAETAAGFDLQVYRDQLREVERDLTRGVISAEEAERLRREIGRKVLEADRRAGEESPAARRNSAGWIGAVLALALLLGGAVWLYEREGVPGMPDLPLAERIAAAEAAYDSRPSQTEAEAAAPVPDRGEIDADYAALIEELRAAVAKTPDDPQGLALLSMHETRLGNLEAAITAQRHLIEVKGPDATAYDHLMLVSQLIEAAGGLITPEAEDELARALQLEPQSAQGRYMLGLLQAQNGRPDRAFPIWRDLLEEGPADAPWIAPIRAAIPDLAWLAGQPDYTPPKTAMPALPGPDADAVAAAEGMSEEEREQMISGMVQQLESRLATEGGSPEEWARLISALVVQGRADHAGEIWGEAQTRFAAQPEALEVVRKAATEAGLAE
ncbi:c-type cytochrome biogenesis protein CcmI [Paracoccus zhejiangensis]|uniref:C-type cytochrome biogenesis protein CcmI n=2 Tax=Paracoccus zhejiangensis TaxID=1077935 RepID=A0A2H5F4J2_9RHOB|nr:c-type cytochrome biogenesis protein CcmI [Paracoccus zhejiangensis]